MRKGNPLLIVNPLRKPIRTTRQSVSQGSGINNGISKLQTLKIRNNTKQQSLINNNTEKQDNDICSSFKSSQNSSEQFIPKGNIIINKNHHSLEVNKPYQIPNYAHRTSVQHSPNNKFIICKQTKKNKKDKNFPKNKLFNSFYITTTKSKDNSFGKKSFSTPKYQQRANYYNELFRNQNINKKQRKIIQLSQKGSFPTQYASNAIQIINLNGMQKLQQSRTHNITLNRLQMKKLQRHLIQPCKVTRATFSRRIPTTHTQSTIVREISENGNNNIDSLKINIRARKIRNKKEFGYQKIQPWGFEGGQDSQQIS